MYLELHGWFATFTIAFRIVSTKPKWNAILICAFLNAILCYFKLKQRDSELETATKAELAAIRESLPSPDTAMASAESMDYTRRLIDSVQESLRKDIVHCKSIVANHLANIEIVQDGLISLSFAVAHIKSCMEQSDIARKDYTQW